MCKPTSTSRRSDAEQMYRKACYALTPILEEEHHDTARRASSERTETESMEVLTTSYTTEGVGRDDSELSPCRRNGERVWARRAAVCCVNVNQFADRLSAAATAMR